MAQIPRIPLQNVDRSRFFSDFPELLQSDKSNLWLFEYIQKHAGFSAYVERRDLDGMLQAAANLPRIVVNILPALYTLSLPTNGGQYDRQKVLAKAVKRQCEILRYLADNLESVLNEGFEEAVNITMHRRRAFGVSLTQVRRALQQKYRIPVPRGRPARPTGDPETTKAKQIFQTAMNMLSGWTKGNRITTVRDHLLPWFQSQPGAPKIDPDGLEETLHEMRQPRRIGLHLTARLLGKSTKAVERLLR